MFVTVPATKRFARDARKHANCVDNKSHHCPEDDIVLEKGEGRDIHF